MAAAVLRSARAEARAEVAARTPFSRVQLPHQQLRSGKAQVAPIARKVVASNSKVSVPKISDLIAQRLASAREASAAEFLGTGVS